MLCMVCGIILPVRFMEVDHQRPKSKGQDEAIVKVMRVLRLTIARPHGVKCMQLYDCMNQALRRREGHLVWSYLKRYLWKENAMAKDDPQTPEIFPFVPVYPKDVRGPPVPNGSTTQMRYTLNMEGEIFYSLIRALEPEPPLALIAVHSLANLRPVCGPCNKTRGKTSLKFPPIST